jgi:hypothetical protein
MSEAAVMAEVLSHAATMGDPIDSLETYSALMEDKIKEAHSLFRAATGKEA